MTRERSHRREELRHYYTLPATAADRKVLRRWSGLKSLTMVYRQPTVGDSRSAAITYYISSHEANVRARAEHIRSHWSIEDRQHHDWMSPLPKMPAAAAKAP